MANHGLSGRFLIACLLLMAGWSPAAEGVDGRLPHTDEGQVDAHGRFVPVRPGVDGEQPEPPGGGGARAAAPEVRKLGEGRFAVGPVTIDRQARTITIPAQVNMVRGLVEYALVTTSGKTHESLFVTDAGPLQVHAAALLLGMEPKQAKAREDGGLDVPVPGRIGVSVTWARHGPAADYRLEELILQPPIPASGNTEPGRPLAEGPWHYNGSRLLNGRFLAQEEGSFIALIPDSYALVNNPRPSRMSDDNHVPRHELLPAEGAPVRIILTLPQLENLPE